MKAPYLHYCFFKEVTENLNAKYKNQFEYDDALLFNLATFSNIGDYYSLSSFRDKYHFTEEYNLNYDKFITECLLHLDRHNDFKELLFLYAMVASHHLDRSLNDYILKLKSDDYSVLEAYNMVDYFYSKKNNEDLFQTSFYKRFKNGFVYYDYMDDLLHYPCVTCMKLMASEAYFKKCYKKKKKFFKYFTRSNYRYPLHFMISAMRKSDYKMSEFIYKKDIDFNLIRTKTEKKVMLSLEDTLSLALEDTLHDLKAIDEYLFDGNDSGIRKAFHIPKEKLM